jgi:hypothetical protein
MNSEHAGYGESLMGVIVSSNDIQDCGMGIGFRNDF